MPGPKTWFGQGSWRAGEQEEKLAALLKDKKVKNYQPGEICIAVELEQKLWQKYPITIGSRVFIWTISHLCIRSHKLNS